MIHSWYNSMQVTARRTRPRQSDLTLHFAYTWSKNMQAGAIIDTVNRVRTSGSCVNLDRTSIAIDFGSVLSSLWSRKVAIGRKCKQDG